MPQPFQSFPRALLVLSPRITLTSNPSTSVQGINTTPIADGALVYCVEGPVTFRLDKADNTTPPDGVTVIKPSAGPGRWKVFGAGGGSAPLSRAFIALASQSLPPTPGGLTQVPGSVVVTFPSWTAGDVLEGVLSVGAGASEGESLNWGCAPEVSLDSGATWHPIINGAQPSDFVAAGADIASGTPPLFGTYAQAFAVPLQTTGPVQVRVSYANNSSGNVSLGFAGSGLTITSGLLVKRVPAAEYIAAGPLVLSP
jgi:hypothetical protein